MQAPRITENMCRAVLHIHRTYGVALEVLAPATGYTSQGIRKAAERFGLPPFRSVDEMRAADARTVTDAEARLMGYLVHEVGLPIIEVARIAGRHYATVSNAVKRAAARPAAPSQKRGRRTVDDEEFIALWNGAECVEQVTAATGLSVSGARTRASTLRKRGNALKRLAKRDDSRRGAAKKITDDELVEAWLAADHIGDVVIATGLSNGRIYQRISDLRKAGREIPRMDKKNRVPVAPGAPVWCERDGVIAPEE